MGAIWVWKTLFKALASPSLIALSSKDPIITAFQLSDELKRLAAIESQFKEEYKKLRKIVQEFAVGLVEQARTSYELEVFLNYNPGGTPWKPGTYKMLITCFHENLIPNLISFVFLLNWLFIKTLLIITVLWNIYRTFLVIDQSEAHFLPKFKFSIEICICWVLFW